MRMEHKLLSSEPSALIPMHFRFPVIRETWTSNAPERFQPPTFLPPAPSLISDIINARQNTCLLWWSDSHICRGSTWETNLNFDLIRRPALSRGGEWTYVTMRARDATVTRRFIQSLDRKKPCKPYPVWLKCGGLPSCLVSIFFFFSLFSICKLLYCNNAPCNRQHFLFCQFLTAFVLTNGCSLQFSL